MKESREKTDEETVRSLNEGDVTERALNLDNEDKKYQF